MVFFTSGRPESRPRCWILKLPVNSHQINYYTLGIYKFKKNIFQKICDSSLRHLLPFSSVSIYKVETQQQPIHIPHRQSRVK